MTRNFYITTAIDYANAAPHIGHVYEKIIADVLARYHRLAGFQTRFLTGTDEHGEKIAKAAAAAGESPQAFVDRLSLGSFQHLYDQLSISYDDFIRTTEDRHKRFVQMLLQRARDNDDIYFAQYEGLYSVGAERYVTEKELVDGKLPGDRDPPELRREANYFLRMEKYRPWLLEHLGSHPDLVQPAGYRNELLEMLREPIGDLSISRPIERVGWGIPIPWDEGHVTYVWFDALTNYVSALSQPDAADGPLYRAYWSRAWHLIGKDILKPHGVFWPIMLKATGLPVYEKLVVHGHILAEDGTKMGKSLGNAVDPIELLERYGADALRYALVRETTFNADSPFGEGILVARLNSDLANDLGNLLSRTLAMLEKYRAGVVPAPDEPTERERRIQAAARELPGRVLEEARNLRLHVAIEASLEFVRDLNRYVAESKPWALAKDEGASARLDTVLYTLVEGLRVASVLLEPTIPTKARELRAQLGLGHETYQLHPAWGLTPAGTHVAPGEVLFPKVELASKPQTAPAVEPGSVPRAPEIGIEDFARVELRVAEVIACEAVPKADKLLRLTVSLGKETRTVVSGIARWYSPEALVGKRVVLVANLKPVKLRGILSQGMILAAEDDDGNLAIVSPEKYLPAGTLVR